VKVKKEIERQVEEITRKGIREVEKTIRYLKESEDKVLLKGLAKEQLRRLECKFNEMREKSLLRFFNSDSKI